MKLAIATIFMAALTLGAVAEASAETYTAYCVNGRIVIETKDLGKMLAQYPMSSNDVYTMMKFNDKNQADNWASSKNYQCPRRK